MFDKLDEADKKAELGTFIEDGLYLKHALNERLAQLLREEELKWYQRAKVKNLLEGDANTKYFKLVANVKHRKTLSFNWNERRG